MHKDYIAALQGLLCDKADPKTKDWWQGYVKQAAPFMGVKMADIRMRSRSNISIHHIVRSSSCFARGAGSGFSPAFA